MKIKPEHYAQLKTEVECLLPRDFNEIRQRIKDDMARVKDIDKRFRWDILWKTQQSKWICDVLYSYLNDTHIDTALKQIVKELGLKP